MTREASAAWPSKGRGYVADYKPFTLVDGPGIRCAVYFSGCFFACDGCYNKKAQSFKAGMPADHDLMSVITEDLRQPYVSGVSLLGGDPFSNTALALPIAEMARGFGKNVWAWTGFTYEWLVENASDDQAYLLAKVSFLVDGPYVKAQHSTTHKYRGSANQRIIDVQDSLRRGRVMEVDIS